MCSSYWNSYVEGEKDDVGWARRIKHLQDGISKKALKAAKDMYKDFDLAKSEALPILDCHASEVPDQGERSLYLGHDLYYSRYWRANKFLGAMFATHKRTNGYVENVKAKLKPGVTFESVQQEMEEEKKKKKEAKEKEEAAKHEKKKQKVEKMAKEAGINLKPVVAKDTAIIKQLKADLKDAQEDVYAERVKSGSWEEQQQQLETKVAQYKKDYDNMKEHARRLKQAAAALHSDLTSAQRVMEGMGNTLKKQEGPEYVVPGMQSYLNTLMIPQ